MTDYKSKAIAIMSLVILLTTGCVSMTYSSSVVNGKVKSTICSDGECRTLYGLGRIDYDHKSQTVTITCQGKPSVSYYANSIKKFDCDSNRIIE